MAKFNCHSLIRTLILTSLSIEAKKVNNNCVYKKSIKFVLV